MRNSNPYFEGSDFHKISRQRRPPTAPVVGLDQHQEPGLFGHPLRPGINRRPYREYPAAGNAGQFPDHGKVEPTLETDLDGVRFVLQSLEEVGVSMAQVTQELEDEGVASFSKSFDALLSSVEAKRQGVCPDPSPDGTTAHPAACLRPR